MARKTPSRLELRKQVEAAEQAGGADGGKKAKKESAKKKPTRARKSKEKSQQRKRLVWGVFNGSMKEEARFPYDQRKQAEERIELLRSKSKKLYFIQPIKELLTDAAPVEA